MNVFRDLLGPTYDSLPQAVRKFHDHEATRYEGTAFSGGAGNVLARLIRRVFGFPAMGEALSVDIRLDQVDGRDRWRRDFGGRKFASSFVAAPDGTLDERFSPFRFGFRLRVSEQKMHWDFERWSIGPLRLPKVLGPKIETWETQAEDGSFEFYSHADFPMLGRLVHYHGRVKPVSDN